MNILLFVLPWVFGSVAIGLGIGFYLGLSRCRDDESATTEKDRESTLKMLTELLEATEQLTSDVNERNVEIKEVGENLIAMDIDGALGDIQHRLMTQVSKVLESNMRLEDDLTVTRSKVEEQAVVIDRTRREARTDALSGVANRKAMDEQLQAYLARLRRRNTPFAVLLADVDNFKRVNDTHGHAAGDVLVAHIGEFLKSCVRSRDFVARYGGDEFVLLLSVSDLETAAQAAERLRNKICQQTFDLGTGAEQAAVTFSIGVATSWTEATAEQLLDRADNALYASKNHGRNCATCYRDGEMVSVDQILREVARRESDEDAPAIAAPPSDEAASCAAAPLPAGGPEALPEAV